MKRKITQMKVRCAEAHTICGTFNQLGLNSNAQ